MTKKEIEVLGFYVEGRILKGGSNRIFHEPTETEVNISGLKEMKPKDFIIKIYNIAFEYGKKYGENLKVEEIKKALCIDESRQIVTGYRIN